MNLEDTTSLFDTLGSLGFGFNPIFREAVNVAIERNALAFELSIQHNFTETAKMECLLFFRKSDKLNIYFFNKYDAVLKRSYDGAKDRRQTFYINRGKGVTFKEAFNLLEGRAVYKHLTSKEKDEYDAWIQLDFSHKDAHDNYKTKQYTRLHEYDLEDVLAKYSIHELKSVPLKEGLIRSLKRGNMHVVTLCKKNKMEKMMIEANPRFKTINIYRPGKGMGPFQPPLPPSLKE